MRDESCNQGWVWIIIGLAIIVWAAQESDKKSPVQVVRESKQTRPTYDEIEMNVTAYCPCEQCCGEWADGITASGKPAEGKLIAAPRKYAFGTVMEVPGYGRAVVEDRGGAIKGDKIDLLFPTHQDALNWGRQYVKVKVYR